jgi:hypothetical protein
MVELNKLSSADSEIANIFQLLSTNLRLAQTLFRKGRVYRALPNPEKREQRFATAEAVRILRSLITLHKLTYLIVSIHTESIRRQGSGEDTPGWSFIRHADRQGSCFDDQSFGLHGLSPAPSIYKSNISSLINILAARHRRGGAQDGCGARAPERSDLPRSRPSHHFERTGVGGSQSRASSCHPLTLGHIQLWFCLATFPVQARKLYASLIAAGLRKDKEISAEELGKLEYLDWVSFD